MKATDVHIYKMEEVAYFANDVNPGVDIGQMLSLLSKEANNTDLILCYENNEPVIIKLGNKIHDFDSFENPPENIFKRIPFDSYWSKLKDREMITIVPREIQEEFDRLKLPRDTHSYQFAAAKLLESKLEKQNKDIGIFTTESGKLATIVRYFPHNPEILVEEKSFDYQQLMRQLSWP